MTVEQGCDWQLAIQPTLFKAVNISTELLIENMYVYVQA